MLCRLYCTPRHTTRGELSPSCTTHGHWVSSPPPASVGYDQPHRDGRFFLSFLSFFPPPHTTALGRKAFHESIVLSQSRCLLRPGPPSIPSLCVTHTLYLSFGLSFRRSLSNPPCGAYLYKNKTASRLLDPRPIPSESFLL